MASGVKPVMLPHRINEKLALRYPPARQHGRNAKEFTLEFLLAEPKFVDCCRYDRYRISAVVTRGECISEPLNIVHEGRPRAMLLTVDDVEQRQARFPLGDQR